MCNPCKNMIYDILIDPLQLTHLLHSYINTKSLRLCAVEVSDCFYRAVKDFPSGPEFFSETYEQKIQILSSFDCDEIIWDRFHYRFPEFTDELKHAIDICIDSSVAKKTIIKEQLIKHFLMDKLRKILVLIPSVHREHTEKTRIDEYASLGPVDICKIISIRRSAGLPVDKYLPKNVYYF